MSIKNKINDFYLNLNVSAQISNYSLAMGMFVVPAAVGMLADYFLIYKVLAFTSIPFLAYIFIFSRKTGKVQI